MSTFSDRFWEAFVVVVVAVAVTIAMQPVYQMLPAGVTVWSYLFWPMGLIYAHFTFFGVLLLMSYLMWWRDIIKKGARN